MKAPVRRRIVVITVIALVVFAVVYGFMPKPVSVDIATAVRGPLRVTINEEGRTRVKDRYIVSAPVSGYMQRVELDVGDRVLRGETVVSLEPMQSDMLDPRSRAEAEAAVSSARGALNSAEENARAAAASAEYAQQRLERNRKLFESGYIARDLLDQSEADAKRTEADRLSAEAAVESARSELERARAVIRYSAARERAGSSGLVPVRAPVTGSILRIIRESEGAVIAGDPIVEIGNPSQLEIRAEVLSSDAVNIRPGTPVLLDRWGGDVSLQGRVKIVEPTAFTKVSSLGVEEQRVLVIAEITSMPESWQRLGDGYRVEARFIIWEGNDILQVPESALFRKDHGWAVFVIKEKRASLREVEIGRRSGLSAEVLSGVSEGEAVIIHPDEAIGEGIKVKLRE
jgi:HlyD family secretion protein